MLCGVFFFLNLTEQRFHFFPDAKTGADKSAPVFLIEPDQPAAFSLPGFLSFQG